MTHYSHCTIHEASYRHMNKFLFTTVYIHSHNDDLLFEIFTYYVSDARVCVSYIYHLILPLPHSKFFIFIQLLFIILQIGYKSK